MSTYTNPFRRNSSLKLGPSDSSAATSIAEHRGTSPLSVNTKVTTTKHVNFASPPAAQVISPVSYPESPESARQEIPSGFPSPSAPVSLAATYSQALSSDPFAAETSDGEDDQAIEQALKNANYNNAIVVGNQTTGITLKGNDVRDTLARFASGPRASAAYQQTTTGTNEQSGSAKLTMDVDAFKRMLLTGERQSARLGDGTSHNTHAVSVQPISDNSSTTDTASISQRSIFETAPPTLEESPRTSEELDTREAEKQRAGLGSASAGRKPPAPPKSRRGKSVHETGDAAAVAKFDTFINAFSVSPAEQPGSSDKDSLKSSSIDQGATGERFAIPLTLESQKRTPPAVPLARRKSERQAGKPALARNSSSQVSVLSDDPSPSPTTTNFASRAPPPPPARRMTSTSERRPSLDVIHDLEGDHTIGKQAFPELPSTDSRHGTVQTPTYLKRTGQAPPPPVPAPRRGRGSSRSSVETQRPSLGALSVPDAGSGEPIARQDSSDARDILAEIAALQREVDAARATTG